MENREITYNCKLHSGNQFSVSIIGTIAQINNYKLDSAYINLFLILLTEMYNDLKSKCITHAIQIVPNSDWHNFLEGKTTWGKIGYDGNNYKIMCTIDTLKTNILIGLGLDI